MSPLKSASFGVLLLYFIVIISIGLYMGRKEENLKDFALGGRQFRGGPCSLRSSPRKQAPALFSERRAKASRCAITPICSSRSAQSSARILVSYIFIKPYYDYKVYSIYEYLTARFGVPTKNAASAIFMVTRVLASGARLYVAAIALALAYEMIRGVQPGQTRNASHLHRRDDCHRDFDRHLHDARRNQSGHLDRFHPGLDHDWQRADRGRLALLRKFPAAGTRSCNATAAFGFRDFFTTGLDPAKHGWDKIKGMFEIEYTIFAGLIGSTFITMATHGTDQDMVQRMLTAPDIRRSRRSLILSGLADIPIVLTFLTIGLLLWVYYQAHPDPTLPKTPNETFCHFILYQMPVGLRGLLDRRNFRDRHGLAQHRDKRAGHQFHARLVRALHQSSNRTSEQSLRAVRWATVWFSILMIIVASTTSYLVIVHPERPHHPDRARDFRLHLRLASRRFPLRHVHQTPRQQLRQHYRDDHGLHRRRDLERSAEQHRRHFRRVKSAITQPSWLPVMEFPWWICFGTIVTFSVAILFRTEPRTSSARSSSGELTRLVRG